MSEIKNNIFYTGVKVSDNGTSYNSYIVQGEKTAIIDGVPENLSDEFIKNIEEILPIKNIDYIVCNHTEPDHSGSVRKVIEKNSDITVIGTIAAIKNLKEITNMTFNEMIAKDGEVLDLGKGKQLKFIITPNLNWPDTMMTYELDEKVLFSCDVFGSCFSEDNKTFDYELTDSDKYKKAQKDYYDTVMKPFGGFVSKAMEKISDLDISMLCTGCGPIITKDISDIIGKYGIWSKEYKENKKTLAVFYVSTYGYTRDMADMIADTASKQGFEVRVFDIQKSSAEEMCEALNSAYALAFGTPTVNRTAPEEVWNVISKLDMVNRKGTPYFVFGSYGWSGEALHYVHAYLNMLHLKPFDKPFANLLKLSDEKRNELKEYTKRFTESIL